jgi:hypothetical protein
LLTSTSIGPLAAFFDRFTRAVGLPPMEYLLAFSRHVGQPPSQYARSG